MKITFKIDCWALGLILYFLCTLSHAFTVNLDSVETNVLAARTGQIADRYSPLIDEKI